MERLTYRDQNGAIDAKIDGSGIQGLVYMLFAYEEAEEQGRLVRLPCAIGAKIYDIGGWMEDEPEEKTVDGFRFEGDPANGYEIIVNGDVYCSENIGQGFHLTLAEAEAALAEQEGEAKHG